MPAPFESNGLQRNPNHMTPSPFTPERQPIPLWWVVAMLAVTAGWAGLQLPYGYSLQTFVMFDAGWALSTDALLRQGLIPTVDFTYFYGLLALSIDRVWFAIFGATPEAQVGLELLCAGLTAMGVVRFAAALRLGLPALLVMLAAAPMAIMPRFFPTPVHALEPALLVNVLAFQARGRLAAALGLATVCLFVKPTMAGVYGLILMGFILFGAHARARSFAHRLRDLLPAAAVGIAIAGLLIAQYGVGPLLATQIPGAGTKLYAAENFGFFFGQGRQLWLPDEMTWWYYPFTQVTFWIVATFILVFGAIRLLPHRRSATAQTVFTCAVLHMAFIFFIFGNQYTWTYYAYLLVCGVAGTIDRVGQPNRAGEPRSAALPAIVIGLALLGQMREMLVCLGIWLVSVSSPATKGLMASPADAELWAWVRDKGNEDKVLVFAPVSAAHEIYPELASPRSWFLLRPIANAAEVERLRQQIRSANWLIATNGPGFGLAEWQELSAECRCFTIDRQKSTVGFLVLRRQLPPR